ncbi:hypothetical protein N2152v2_006814 [Parachlorella kessleri]
MPHVHTLEELIPPWVADEAWQQTSDSIFKSLAKEGGLTLQLPKSGLHQSAMQAAYACSKDLVNHPALGAQAPRTPGASLGEGWMGEGYQQEFSYQSGPRPAGDLGSQQHSTWHKAMAAGQDLCMLVLNCLAASRGVRLPPAALQRLVEMPPFDPQHLSASILRACFPSAGMASWTPAAGDPRPDDAYKHGIHPGLLTLVYAPDQGGLEVINASGEWQAVGPLGEDQVLLVSGHTLEYALCGLLPAAQYRVVALNAGVPQGHCLTFERRPAPDALVDFVKELDETGHAVLARRYPPMTGADLLAHISRGPNRENVAPSGPFPAEPLVPQPGPAHVEAPLDAGVHTPAQAEPKPAEDADSQLPFSVGASGSSASEHDRAAACVVPGLVSGEASGRAALKGQRGKKKLKKVPSSPAVPQATTAADVAAGLVGGASRVRRLVVPAAAEDGQGADEAAATIELVILTMTNYAYLCKVQPSIRLRRIIEAFSEMAGIPLDQLRPVVKSAVCVKRGELDHTPADYGMQNGDTITMALNMRERELQTADAVFKALALDGYLIVHPDGSQQTALKHAYEIVQRIFEQPEWQNMALEESYATQGVGFQDPGQKQAMTAGQEVCTAVLRCISASRGVRLAPGSLADMVETPLDTQSWSASLLHAFHYSTAAAADVADAAAVVDTPAEGPCEAHVDRGLLTLVYAPEQAGLEVMDAYGKWHEVGPLGEDQVVLVPGHTLEYALCGLLPAAQHRVVAPGAGQAPRCSLTFKLRPAPSARIDLTRELDAAGHAVFARRLSRLRAGLLYPPTTGAGLMERFSLTHRSVNGAVGAWPASGVAAPFPSPALAAAGAAAALSVAPAAVDASTAADRKASAQAATSAQGTTYQQSCEQAGLAPSAWQERAAALALPAAPSDAACSEASSIAGHDSHRPKTKIKKVPHTAFASQGGTGGSVRVAGAPQEQLQAASEAAWGALHTATAGAAGGPGAGEADGKMVLVFEDVAKTHRLAFRVRPTSRLQAVFAAYCTQVQVDQDQQRFLFNGVRVSPTSTPANLGMESGDVIDVFAERKGD